MSSVMVVQDNVTLDLVVWQAFGRQDDLLVEQTLELNPGIASPAIMLPVGTVVQLPELAARQATIRNSIKLWS